MARMIILKEDGNLAIFETVGAQFVYDGISEEEYIRRCCEEASQHIREDIHRVMTMIRRGDNPYRGKIKTYEDALTAQDDLYGKKEE